MTHCFFAPCPRGLEPVLADELRSLAAASVVPHEGGVSFSGDETLLYRSNLESRIASRILLHVASASYASEDDIYAAAARLPWHEWFTVARTLRVHVTASRSPLKSLEFVTLRVKDAVCDAFRSATGERPSIDTRNPDVRVHAYLDAARVTFYLDTSGEALFKRGYRSDTTSAPLRENLAAGILRLAEWRPSIPLLDPMCGSGTFLCEAAAVTFGIAPGAGRGFAFERLALYDAKLWREVREISAAHRRPIDVAHIHGSDRDPRALQAARTALQRAGLERAVHLDRANVLDISAPATQGILVVNPPYGVRMGDQQELATFYPRFGSMLKQRFAGWTCHVFTADQQLPKLIGLKPSRRTPLFNGALECRLYRFEMVAGSHRRQRAPTPSLIPPR